MNNVYRIKDTVRNWANDIWVNNAFEKIGTTAVDLSGYVQATEMHALTNSEIDTIFGQVWT